MTVSLAEQVAELFGLQLPPAQAVQITAQAESYSRELAAWNVHTNLTAITAPEAVQVKHFLDSLSIISAAAFTPGLKVIDVGSGAGFPGLPLAMVFPDIHMMLLEATGKKVAFLQHIITLLKLPNVETLKARAEEAGQMNDQRAAYDLVLARAVARLPSLLEYLLPLAKVGGLCIAMKGKTASEEADDSTRALSVLGGRLKDIKEIHLPGVEETHYLVVIEKIAHTPLLYPRKPGMPTRNPIT